LSPLSAPSIIAGRWRETTDSFHRCSLKESNPTDNSFSPRRFRSTQRLKHLERITKGRVIPGHDAETFQALQKEKDVFT